MIAPRWTRIHAWDHGLTVDATLAREFEERLLESSSLAVRVAYSVLRNREDAEDVAQEAFTKAYRSFSQLRDRERFRAWLVRMTWRMALDRQRANRRRTVREGRVDSWSPAGSRSPASAGWAAARDGGADVQVGLEARERAEHLWRAIDGLSEKLRLVIILAGIQGHDVKEVSALLELPEGTVKSRLFAARQQLKEALSWMASDQTR
jgi:RNA polymerase sigma-70 factor (ECF subfamily)